MAESKISALPGGELTAPASGDLYAIVDDSEAVLSDKTKYIDHDNIHNVTKWLSLPASSELTISAGSITPTQSYHTVDTEGGGASDDLVTIVHTGISDGTILVLIPEDGARTVVIKHASDNIYCRSGADYTMDEAFSCAILIKDGVKWVCLDF